MVCKSTITFYVSFVNFGFILTKWYVNKFTELWWEYTKRFILTKWYVNIKRITITTTTILRFILTKWYVNFESGKTALSLSKCFILTKWYVNLLILLF
mgnify:FL=1